jgi:hypothetical protein
MDGWALIELAGAVVLAGAVTFALIDCFDRWRSAPWIKRYRK